MKMIDKKVDAHVAGYVYQILFIMSCESFIVFIAKARTRMTGLHQNLDTNTYQVGHSFAVDMGY